MLGVLGHHLEESSGFLHPVVSYNISLYCIGYLHGANGSHNTLM